MRDRVARLRLGLLGSAVLLVLVIGAFMGYARLRARLHHLKLPGNLGVNIVRESGGWTLSRAAGSRTLYTIHAAKVDQHTNGKIALHDVWIVLYGKKGDRRDRITGQDFEYDEKAGVVRAMGVVHLDLQAASAAATAGDQPAAANDTKVLHVTTSGLVYLEKLGVAATSEYIEFQSGAMKGHATGADYSSDSGMLLLHSAVSMSGTEGGQPVEMTAGSAEFDEHDQQAVLTDATYASPDRRARADHAVLYRRPDGSLQRVLAENNVVIQAKGGTVNSQRADVMLNATGQPESAYLSGGVVYSAETLLRQARGTAGDARIAFGEGKNPQPKTAVFNGSVRMIERVRPAGRGEAETAREPWSVRDLNADKVVTDLVSAGDGKSELRDAEVTGGAHLVLVDEGSLASSKGTERTELSADDLKAHMKLSGNGQATPQLDTLDGRGHTVVRQLSPQGIDQTSTGDTLHARFETARTGGSAGAKPGTASESLSDAVQQGNVTVVRRSPAKTKAGAKADDTVQHAVAHRAAYDAATNRITLTGDVSLTDAGSVVWANQVAMDRLSGDAQASGGVKVNYDSPHPTSGRNEGPTHILADRAELDHASNIATFHGAPVRLWQGGSQVQAPVISVDSDQKRLIARGENATGWAGALQPPQVHTVLANVPGQQSASQTTDSATPTTGSTTPTCGTGKPKAAGSSSHAAGADAANAPQAVRIASGGLIYSDVLGQADFTGGVRADTADATIIARQATAYLEQSAKGEGAQAAGPPSIAGSLERVVATGKVEISRPGLSATGERLVYAAGDQDFLLTGTPNAPPRAVDARGTTTGAALRFNTCDDSVEALGQVPGEPARRVRTETHVSDKKKDNKR